MSESRIVEVTDEEAEKFMKKDAEKSDKENGIAEKVVEEKNET